MKKSSKTKTIKKHLKESFLVALLSIPFTFIFCTDCTTDFWKAAKVFSIAAPLWVILWKGNEFISYYWNKRLSWIENPVKTLLILGSSSVIFTGLTIIGIFMFYSLIYNIDPYKTIEGTIITAILIAIFIGTFMHGREFLFAWRQSAINEERLRNENLTSKYEALKNQVNPHFLFNSLNTLSSLVYNDQELAAKFIHKLSGVYRYVLESKDKELVDLNTEIVFLKSYIFLQKIRFGDNLKVNLNLPENSNFKVPPLSLQMLIENAIKHNTISKEEPLAIDLKLKEGNYIAVENNLQKKNRLKDKSSEIGLNNIKARYEFLTDHEVRVTNNGKSFKVELPVITS